MLWRPHRCALLAAALAAAALPARAAEGGKPARVAHIKLSGSMEEKPLTEDPLLGALGETFKTRLDRIRKAAKDKEIQALYLEINGLGVGWGKMEELCRAVADFRKTGKKAYAYVESGMAKDYLLGLSCDDLCLPETGWLLLTGVRAEVSFYKDLFDKIGVKADFLQFKEYKGAAEPFTRNSLSEANRKQLESLVNDFYEQDMVERIVRSRPGHKFTAEKVKKLIDEGPYAARAAVRLGLVDRVGYAESVEDQVKSALKAEKVEVVRDYGKKKDEVSIFSIYRKLIFGPSKLLSSPAPKVAVIYATGPIITGKGGSSLLLGSTVGSDTMIKAIRQADKDKTVKAIVLRIDSPGGSAVASDLIWNETLRCKKPVVASMSDVAGSGGYYIAMGARQIYAEPGTITGSIGVVGGKFATAAMWAKIGVRTEVISRGAHSGILSSEAPFSPSEKARFKAMMQDVYDQFVDKALEGRKKVGKKLSRDQLEKMARGRVYTGRQAKENGLIDELGTLEDAIAAAWKLAGMPAAKEPELLLLPKARSVLDELLSGELDVRSARLEGRLLPLLREVPELAGKLRPAAHLLGLRREPVWAVLPFHLEVK
jgi:protease-4